jgi:hypothetical protein
MQAASEESEKAKVRAGLAGDRENRELGREWAATSATWNELFR